jgi:hypothetical protein
MSDDDRRFLVEKCGQILHAVLVEIRNLSYQEGNAKRINDLTDLTHNIPLFMVAQDPFVMGYLRDGLIEYARKYYPDIDPVMSRYVWILDMDEASFAKLYRRSMPA